MRLLRGPSRKSQLGAWGDEGCPFVVADVPPSMDEVSYDVAFGGKGNHAFRRTARYHDGLGRFVYVQTYRPGSVTSADVKKQALDNARRFASRHPGGRDDRQLAESRADWASAEVIFNSHLEMFEVNRAADGLSVAVGSPGGTLCSVTALRTPLGDIRLRLESPAAEHLGRGHS